MFPWFAETHIVNIVMSVSVCLYLSVFTLTKSSLTLNANRISCRRFGRGRRILLSLPDPESIFLGCSVSKPPPVFPFRFERESYTTMSEIHLLLFVLILMIWWPSWSKSCQDKEEGTKVFSWKLTGEHQSPSGTGEPEKPRRHLLQMKPPPFSSFCLSGWRRCQSKLDLWPAVAFSGVASRRGRHSAPRALGAAARAAGADPQPVGRHAAHEPQHGLHDQRHQNDAAARHERHDASRYTWDKHSWHGGEF